LKDISIALGGGGIRGIAHIGVIRCLESHGFSIKSIAGTSAGGLIGAAFAAGYTSEEIEEAASKFSDNRNFKRQSTDNPSLLGVQGISNLLQKMLGDKRIEDFPIPFVTTAVSIKTGQEIFLNKGKAIDAILATIAIPGVLPSQEIGGRILMDGGVLDPVPVRAARGLNPTLPIVAVVLNKKPIGYNYKESPLPFSIQIPSTIVEQIAKIPLVEALTIFTRSVEVSSDRLSELNLIIDKPDVIIEPIVGQYNLLDKVNAIDLIKAGKIAAELVIPDLEKACRGLPSLKRQWRYGLATDDNVFPIDGIES